MEPAAGVDAIVVEVVADGLALEDPAALSASFERVVVELNRELGEFFETVRA